MKYLWLLVVVGATGFALFGLTRTNGQEGINRVTASCVFWSQYRAQIDPIVSPGIQQSAHMHDFYGRVDISNYMFARPAWPPVVGSENDPGYHPLPSSCRTYGDWAGYWYPTPKWNGAFILSGELQVTLQAPAGVQVATPPYGMAVVAQTDHSRWTCGGLDEAGYANPHDCTGLGTVTAELTFPDCWDGVKTFDIPAGVGGSHFAYSSGGSCPGSHSTRMAQVVTRQHFLHAGNVLVNPRNPDGTIALSFASGPFSTYHGDFLNTWNIGLKQMVDGCLNGIGSCPQVQ